MDTAVAAPAPAKAVSRISRTVTLAALGVVFGDIGTSPLYTLKTCFTTAHVEPTPQNVLGIISALLWTIFIVVCIKYVTFVMKVDFNGEGGIFALLARLMPPAVKGVFGPLTFLTLVAVVGGATLFGDGLITPAISVLSAVEGLSGLTSEAVKYEVAITVVILIGLFVIQSRGTEKIGFLFGPVMALWFVAIAASGGAALVHQPQILQAFNPVYALEFITRHGIFGFLVLGATVLAVTGVEALYADMSHFGRGSITLAWYALVFPALLLSYLGQGAMVLGNPHALENVFFSLTPGVLLVPMVVLATAATVIASQALISGAFTLVEQGIALNLVPRMRVIHTSNRYPGQVFVPAINVLLGIGCVLLVVVFKSSDALASAYGLSVSLTMLATTILFYAVIRRVLKWNPIVATSLFVVFLIVDGSFVLAGLGKIHLGGWIPLAIAAVLTVLATTWYDGRRRVQQSLADSAIPVDAFLAEIAKHPLQKIEGTAVFLSRNPSDVPLIVKHHWLRIRALDERIVLLTLVRATEPYVSPDQRITVERLSDRFVRVQASFGFMELPDLKAIIAQCAVQGLHLDDDDTTFVVAAPQIVPKDKNGMKALRRWLFDVMQRLAGPVSRDLVIPPDRLVELGVEVKV
ncbi:MAG: potassium transporter Kup [Candidatus Velthaea sp.]